MHGTGNDYIYVDASTIDVQEPSILAKQVSDRHFGVGSDGLVLILPSTVADFRMRMFNADGSESEMCGNASRCIGKYVYDKGLTAKTTVLLETGAGIRELQLSLVDGKVGSVCVDMGKPILDPASIPVSVYGEQAVYVPVTVDGVVFEVTCVSMGNPHAVLFTTGIDDLDLTRIGPLFENNEIFPNRVNTEFVEVLSSNHVKMRVWERGAGETMACGTGACAVLVAGVLRGLLQTKATIDLPGGSLTIEWKQDNQHVYLTGEAAFVYEGELY
jgi:diaminopimelate epimerase